MFHSDFQGSDNCIEYLHEVDANIHCNTMHVSRDVGRWVKKNREKRRIKLYNKRKIIFCPVLMGH